jgi:hypothetical protein
MTINLLKDPVIDINKYLLAELYASGALEESDYLVDSIQWKPIFPVQEPPEFSVSNPINPKTGFHGEPFLVYDVAIPMYGTDQFWNCEEQVLYSIYARDYRDARRTQLAVYDIFHRQDLSARDVNEFLGSDSPYRFHWVNVVDSPPPDPKDSPDDFSETFIMIEYEYSRWIGPDGRFAS